MKRTIELPESLFLRLGAVAVPFEDTTPAAVVERITRFYEQHHTQRREIDRPVSNLPVSRFTPAELPNLTDTRIVHAKFGGHEIQTQFWNDLVRKAHEIVYPRCGDFGSLKRISTANIAEGDLRGEKGYKLIEGMNFSIQGVDSNEAWRIVYHMARKLDEPLEITFEWRTTDRAERPGEIGSVEWKPAKLHV